MEIPTATSIAITTHVGQEVATSTAWYDNRRSDNGVLQGLYEDRFYGDSPARDHRARCTLLAAPSTNADIYRWDTGEVIPGTEGIQPGPGVRLVWWNTDDRNLRYADFSGGLDLTDAGFYANWLVEANLGDADLTRVNLELSDLTAANLADANRTGANLRWATLTGVDFAGAVIQGAVLRGTTSSGFSRAQFE